MRVVFSSYGTRGDVQPMVAMALALRDMGHDVVVAAPGNHLPFITACGLEAAALAGDSEAIMHSPEGQRWLATGNVLALLRGFGGLLRTFADDVLRDLEAIVVGADLVVAGALCVNAARLACEAKGIPWVLAHMYPGVPARDWPHGLASSPALPRPLNPLMTRAVVGIGWRWMHDVDDRQRDLRGLPRAHKEAALATFDDDVMPTLHLWSPGLMPAPAGWSPRQVVTGFCALPSRSRSDLGEDVELTRLQTFLDDGPAPVYVGLGSMPVQDPAAVARLVAEVAEDLDIRVILGARFGTLGTLHSSARVAVVGAVDHDALFPRCRAVLHHGGAGTTAAGLRAGCPTVVCSVFGDQRFWGRIIEEKGLGAHLHFQRLNPHRLKKALRTTLAPAVADRCRALAATMAHEDGATRAAEVLHTWLTHHRGGDVDVNVDAVPR